MKRYSLRCGWSKEWKTGVLENKWYFDRFGGAWEEISSKERLYYSCGLSIACESLCIGCHSFSIHFVLLVLPDSINDYLDCTFDWERTNLGVPSVMSAIQACIRFI